jgi:hypothetical protein
VGVKDQIIYLASAGSLLFVSLFFMPAFAQETDDPTQFNFQPNQTSGEPILEQVSDKGIYRVLFKWPTPVVSPEESISVEIVFLKASAPQPTSENIPETETNDTGASEKGSSGYNVPGSIESTLPVESYDIAIYTSDGNELFRALDQPGQSGRGTQQIQLEGNYTGPVTIELSDIKPGWESGKLAGEDLTDSLTIAAAVIPEFPIYLIGLVIASMIGAAVVFTRFKIYDFHKTP